MTLTAYGADDRTLHRQTYFSIGGGFVVTEGEAATEPVIADEDDKSFSSAAELLALASGTGRSISAVMLAHERRRRSPEEVRTKLLHLRDVMVECEQRGISRTGLLPGALQVRRRAGQWHQRLSQEDPNRDPRFAEDWVNLVALAVNEENASGGRIVTAPTNGAAGIIPAVLHYAVHYSEAGASDADDVTVRFLLTAGAIGSLYKERASISGAEVGWGVAQWPYILPESLEVSEAAAPSVTLTALLVAAVGVALIVVPGFIRLYVLDQKSLLPAEGTD